MTDRYDRFVVQLKTPVRSDMAEPIITALSMIEGVEQVTAHVNGYESSIARESARRELVGQLWEVLKK